MVPPALVHHRYATFHYHRPPGENFVFHFPFPSVVVVVVAAAAAVAVADASSFPTWKIAVTMADPTVVKRLNARYS